MKVEKWGHNAVIAGSGEAALKIIRNEIFDLILLDIFLPDTVAYDLIPHIKEQWSGIKIITMTGYSDMEVEKKVRSQGISYYMVKPINLDELKSIIQHMRQKEG
jgi:DNA-binding response OmpR family regulator